MHDDVVMDRLLLLLACADDELEWSVICVFGRPELVYDECLDGDEVADAGDEGRKIAEGQKDLLAIRRSQKVLEKMSDLILNIR